VYVRDRDQPGKTRAIRFFKSVFVDYVGPAVFYGLHALVAPLLCPLGKSLLLKQLVLPLILSMSHCFLPGKEEEFSSDPAFSFKCVCTGLCLERILVVVV